MPEIGEIRKATEIGFKTPNRYIWNACEECGKERWVRYWSKKPEYLVCSHCRQRHNKGREASGWKGGRGKMSNGYIWIHIFADNFFYAMADKNSQVPEHRLIMAQHLGRCLHRWERVHHKNGVKDDNRIENLELTTMGAHIVMHNKGYRDGYQKGLIDGRTKQVQELKDMISEQTKMIKLLQWQTKEVSKIYPRR